MSTFWEGTGGALIGAFTSALVAVLAIIWTRRDERELMREQMSLTEAYEALRFATQVRRRLDPFIVAHKTDARVDWEAAARFVDSAAADGERFYAYAGVIRPPRIEEYLSWLSGELDEAQDRLPPALAARDRKAMDAFARSVGQGLTNLIDELNRYLRADLDRRAIARLPIWRRFRFTKRFPLVRRVKPWDVRDLDDDGWAKADY